MHEFIQSVEFARLKNFFIKKYSSYIPYEEIISIVNLAVVEAHNKYNCERSSYNTFMYNYSNWMILKFLTKEIKYFKSKKNDSAAQKRSFNDGELKVELEDELQKKSPIGYDYLIKNISKEELTTKYKKNSRQINKAIKEGIKLSYDLVYNKIE